MKIHEIIFLIILFIGYFSSSCLVCSMVGELMKNMKGSGSGTEVSMAFLLVFGLLVIFIVIGSGARKTNENYANKQEDELSYEEKVAERIDWNPGKNLIF